MERVILAIFISIVRVYKTYITEKRYRIETFDEYISLPKIFCTVSSMKSLIFTENKGRKKLLLNSIVNIMK